MSQRKYGFVTADQVKIGEALGSNMHSSSMHMPMPHMQAAPVGHLPGMVRAGVRDWGGMIPSSRQINRKVAKGAKIVKQRREQRATEREGAMQQHPTSQPGVASSMGGNPPGPAPAQPAAATYYEAPSGMGATVPASRLNKFAQGRGSPTSL